MNVSILICGFHHQTTLKQGGRDWVLNRDVEEQIEASKDGSPQTSDSLQLKNFSFSP
jgi:hypothetical protein